MIRAMTCPICHREVAAGVPAEKSFLPFCSQRCQQVDFHRWWQGRYAIVEDADGTEADFEHDE